MRIQANIIIRSAHIHRLKAKELLNNFEKKVGGLYRMKKRWERRLSTKVRIYESPILHKFSVKDFVSNVLNFGLKVV